MTTLTSWAGGNAPVLLDFPDFAQGRLSVHLGHHDVHANEVVAVVVVEGLEKGLHGLQAVHGDIDFSVRAENLLKDLSTGEVVLHNQHAHGHLLGRWNVPPCRRPFRSPIRWMQTIPSKPP